MILKHQEAAIVLGYLIRNSTNWGCNFCKSPLVTCSSVTAGVGVITPVGAHALGNRGHWAEMKLPEVSLAPFPPVLQCCSAASARIQQQHLRQGCAAVNKKKQLGDTAIGGPTALNIIIACSYIILILTFSTCCKLSLYPFPRFILTRMNNKAFSLLMISDSELCHCTWEEILSIRCIWNV